MDYILVRVRVDTDMGHVLITLEEKIKNKMLEGYSLYGEIQYIGAFLIQPMVKM